MAEASDKSKKAKGTKMDWATFVSAGTNSTSKWGDSIDDDAPESNDRSSSGGDSYTRSERSSGGDSYSRSERGGDSYSRSDRGGDSYSRGERGGDSYSRGERGGDSYSRGERGGDSYSRGERGGDSYGRGERGDSYGRSDRGGDSYSRGERGGDSEDRGPRPQKPLPDAPPYTAFLGNLVFSVTEDDVFEFFSANCQVKSVRLITDPGSGQKKGYGYIEFEDRDSLKLALSAEGVDFQGRRLRVDVSDNKPERRTPFSGESRADQAETWERGKQLPASERRALPEREERRGGAGGSGRRYGETFNRRSESDAPPASERRRLVLQPRSGDSPAESAPAADAKPKHNPFGGAKPRDELYFQQKKEEERKQREEEERKKREAAAAEAGESADAAAPAAESTDAADKPAAGGGDDQAAPKTERKGRSFESRRGSDRGGDRGDRGGDRGDRGSRGRGGFRGDRDRDGDDFQRTGSSRRGFPDRRGGDDRRGDDRRPARGGAKDEGRRETRERKVAPPKETPITNAYAALADAEQSNSRGGHHFSVGGLHSTL